jgi:hypothetical protein
VTADRLARSAIAAVVLAAVTSEGQAQSLAEIARIEAERRARVTAPGKVYTNADLIPDFTKPVPPPDPTGAPGSGAGDATLSPPAAPGAPEPAVAPPGGDPPGVTPRDQQEPQPADNKDETYWRNQAQLIRGRLATQNAQIDQLRAREQAFPAGVDSAEKVLVQQTLQKAVADLAFLNEEWLRFERSARELKVPEHWIR